MNIAFLNQNALIQREALSALRRLPGVRVIALDVQTHPTAQQAAQVASILKEHDCRILFSVNEWGTDDNGILWEHCDTHRVLHVNWTVDDPFYEEIIHRKKYRPSDMRIDFVSDKGYVEPMQTQGYSVRFLPLATDPALFYPPENGAQERDIDVVFVGNSYFRQIDSFLRMAPGFIDMLVPFLGEVVSSYLADIAFDVEGAIEKQLHRVKLPVELTFEKAHFIAKHAAGYFGRKRMIKAMVERFRGFTVFGDAGWRQDIPEERIGTAKYYDTLCSVYQRTKITIDINRMVIRNGFTQRAFDAPACGSLLVTSAKPVIYDTFVTEGDRQEVAVFRSLDELIATVDRHLAHPDDRNAVAGRGLNKVVQHHTYDHRIAEIVSVVNEMVG